jgi:hypothetical protein
MAVLRNRRPPRMHRGCTDPLLKQKLRKVPLGAIRMIANCYYHAVVAWRVLTPAQHNSVFCGGVALAQF